MRQILLFLIILIWCQENNCNETTEDKLGIHRCDLTSIKYDLQKRSVSDVWNSIKSTANLAWEHIKTLANKTRKSIADWIRNVKGKAQHLVEAFKERLKKIKEHVNDMIEKIMQTGDIVKKCLQERKQEIDEIFKNILFDATNCISNNLTHLNNLATLRNGPLLNQTEFIEGTENDVYICLQKYKENAKVEKCIQNIRAGIYNKIEITEKYLFENHTKKRDETDHLLNKIIECTTEGIIKSTTIITNETLHIIECVSKG